MHVAIYELTRGGGDGGSGRRPPPAEGGGAQGGDIRPSVVMTWPFLAVPCIALIESGYDCDGKSMFLPPRILLSFPLLRLRFEGG